ncbi:2Fe-2S iron-sulfur cluster binding domain-containing protein [Candidatus Woesearchaeota archaeon]|nr:2Fe-2S iron-sulfur cluster binding domain-containing protein [Candidatus Woesearchaeota archaeon]
MARLVFDGKEVEVKDGDRMKEYARELGVPFGCEHGVCGTCKIDILSGAENLNALNQEEDDMGRDRTHRLACQCKILCGNVEISF